MAAVRRANKSKQGQCEVSKSIYTAIAWVQTDVASSLPQVADSLVQTDVGGWQTRSQEAN
eukprot:7499677-Pyramimonas_sp.AAC.1